MERKLEKRKWEKGKREGKAGEIREQLLFTSGASVEDPKGFSVPMRKGEDQVPIASEYIVRTWEPLSDSI